MIESTSIVGIFHFAIIFNITIKLTLFIGVLRGHKKWKLDDDTYNEIWDAEIVAVGFYNTVQFDGKDHKGNSVVVTIDMDDVRP